MTSFDDGYTNGAVFDSFFGGVHLPITEWVPLFTQIVANMTAAGNTYLNCDFNTWYNCTYQGACHFHAADF